ncbi:hypothetical protein MTO96_031796 [Rhipicephalus appendiculatus]
MSPFWETRCGAHSDCLLLRRVPQLLLLPTAGPACQTWKHMSPCPVRNGGRTRRRRETAERDDDCVGVDDQSPGPRSVRVIGYASSFPPAACEHLGSTGFVAVGER